MVAMADLPVPRFRGRLHQITFFVTIPAGIVLIARARGASEWVSAGVYALTLTGLFATSAAYHRINWSQAARLRMRLLDHSMIYLLIAGTYTPFALLALDGWWRIGLLAAAWAGALFGITVKLVGIEKLAKLGGTLYIVLGWIIVFAFPKIVTNISARPKSSVTPAAPNAWIAWSITHCATFGAMTLIAEISTRADSLPPVSISHAVLSTSSRACSMRIRDSAIQSWITPCRASSL